MNEFWERVLEALGLYLLKVGAAALMKKRERAARPKTIICVEVPAAIDESSGGTVEVHWVGAARIAGMNSSPEDRRSGVNQPEPKVLTAKPVERTEEEPKE